MEDQISSPEKYSMKNSYNKNIFYLNEKNIYDKNISYWIQIYFDWTKIYFDIMEKKGDIMKIYFIEYKFVLIEWKKGDIMKICFIKYKIILIGWKYVFISYEFSFLQHLSNHYCWDIFAGVPKNSILRKQGLNKKTIKN